MVIAVYVANIVLDVWLLTILHRQGARKQLPWFVSYIAWGLLSSGTSLVTWPISRRLYGTVYWWLDGVDVLLTVAAVRESFLRIFVGFTSKRGFRLSLWGVIAGVLVYSAWKAVYAPPIQSNRLASFILGAEFAFRWGIAAVGLLSMIHMRLLEEPLTGREAAVVSGLGFVSVAFLAWVISRSVFGTRFIFFTKYLPTVGYFMAVFWWIRAFSRPVQEISFETLGMEPADVSREMGRYREFIEWLVRQKW